MDARSKVLDAETHQLRLAPHQLVQQQHQTFTATQKAFRRAEQEGARREKLPQSHTDAEVHRLRMEMWKLKSNMVAHATPVVTTANLTGSTENATGMNTRQPPALPTASSNGHGNAPCVCAELAWEPHFRNVHDGRSWAPADLSDSTKQGIHTRGSRRRKLPRGSGRYIDAQWHFGCLPRVHARNL